MRLIPFLRAGALALGLIGGALFAFSLARFRRTISQMA